MEKYMDWKSVIKHAQSSYLAFTDVFSQLSSCNESKKAILCIVLTARSLDPSQLIPLSDPLSLALLMASAFISCDIINQLFYHIY